MKNDKLQERYIQIPVKDAINMYLAEAGLGDLKRTTSNMQDDADREHSDSKGVISDIKYVVYESNNQLLVSGKVTSTKGKAYPANIMFSGVEYHQEDEQTLVTFTSADNQDNTISKLSEANDVKVSCGCMDFYYRFAYHNSQNNTLLGMKPPPYAKKPGSERPPVNPSRQPGMCKHLFGVMDHLKHQGFF